MPSARLDRFVVGRLGSYEVPTIPTLDVELRKLWLKHDAAAPLMRPRILADLDLLLERRLVLQQER